MRLKTIIETIINRSNTLSSLLGSTSMSSSTCTASLVSLNTSYNTLLSKIGPCICKTEQLTFTMSSGYEHWNLFETSALPSKLGISSSEFDINKLNILVMNGKTLGSGPSDLHFEGITIEGTTVNLITQGSASSSGTIYVNLLYMYNSKNGY